MKAMQLYSLEGGRGICQYAPQIRFSIFELFWLPKISQRAINLKAYEVRSNTYTHVYIQYVFISVNQKFWKLFVKVFSPYVI